MNERDIEKHLIERVEALGGTTRKVAWVGRHGAPDRLVLLPRAVLGVMVGPLYSCIWVECKAPGVKPEPHQLREHDRMRALGQHVVVIDSIAGVDELLWP